MKKIIYYIKNKRLVNGLLAFVSGFIFIAFFAACEDFVQIEPPKTELINKTVFEDDQTAIAAINGIYTQMISINSGFASGDQSSITFLAGLSSDELNYFKTDLFASEFNTNTLTPLNSINENGLWGRTYTLIFYANRTIEGLTNSNKISDEVKDQLMGEAKFIRAFCHFYLLNIYGDIPMITTSDYQLNNKAFRDPQHEVLEFVVKELKEAAAILREGYVSIERVRPNKVAAIALLARAYLYQEDWLNAEAQANEVINNSNYALLVDLNSVFLANSTEAIWQLKPNIFGGYTFEGNNFTLTTSPSGSPGGVALTNQFISAFESADDKRLLNWVNAYTDGTSTWNYPYKYKNYSTNLSSPAEYSMVLRLAETYLIRAEARAQLENISGAQDDINAIRSRAGLSNTTATDQASLLTVIENERRLELFTEWGHRWFDLKRTKRADAVLNDLKPDWQSTDVLYPIPFREIEKNRNLIQNQGY